MGGMRKKSTRHRNETVLDVLGTTHISSQKRRWFIKDGPLHSVSLIGSPLMSPELNTHKDYVHAGSIRALVDVSPSLGGGASDRRKFRPYATGIPHCTIDTSVQATVFGDGDSNSSRAQQQFHDESVKTDAKPARGVFDGRQFFLLKRCD